MKLLLLTVNIILGGALLMRVTAIGEFDPNVLSPAGAGLPLQDLEYIVEQSPGNRINCDEMHYRVSVDDVRYLRESRRGMLEVASAENNIGVFGFYGDAHGLGKVRAELEPESGGITKYALYNCDGEYIPSDTFLPGAGLIRMASNAWSRCGEIRSDVMRVPSVSV